MRALQPAQTTSDVAIALQCLNELEGEYVALRSASVQPSREAGSTHSVACPICASTMAVVSAEPLPTIVEMDCATHRLGCHHCGMLTGRIFHCDFGYAPFPV